MLYVGSMTILGGYPTSASGTEHVLTGNEVVRAYFDEHALAWRERYFRDDFDSGSFRDRLVAGVDLLTEQEVGGRVLDAGCGTGVSTQVLTERGFEAFGCDFSMEMCREAREVTSPTLGARIFACDLEASPIKGGAFAGVLMLGVLGFTDDPDRVLDEVHRVLAPGGVLVISSAQRGLLVERVCDWVSFIPQTLYLAAKSLQAGRRVDRWEGTGFYGRNLVYHHPRVFDRLLEEHGFRKVAFRSVNFGIPHFMERTLLPDVVNVWLSRTFAKLAQRPGFNWLDAHARHYVLCVVKS